MWWFFVKRNFLIQLYLYSFCGSWNCFWAPWRDGEERKEEERRAEERRKKLFTVHQQHNYDDTNQVNRVCQPIRGWIVNHLSSSSSVVTNGRIPFCPLIFHPVTHQTDCQASIVVCSAEHRTFHTPQNLQTWALTKFKSGRACEAGTARKEVKGWVKSDHLCNSPNTPIFSSEVIKRSA